MKLKTRQRVEWGIEKILLFCASVSVLAVFFITVFIFQRGLPLFRNVSLWDFLFSTYWLPSDETNPGFGILSFIVGSFYVTFLALAIGNAHGKYKGEPCLDFKRLQAIRDVTGIPLVLHGGSGISDEDFRKAISLGIAKINFFTGMSQAALNATR